MRRDPRVNIIALDVEIFRGDKSRIVRMALDTGATYLMLPWDSAEILGYDPATVRERVSITTASGVERAPLLSLERVNVLGEEVPNVEAICHDLPPQSAMDGLLGLSFLRHFDTDLHFLSRKLDIRGSEPR